MAMAHKDPAVGPDGQRGHKAAQEEDGGDPENLCESLQLLQIDPGWASPQPRAAESERTCSRNVLRKQRRWERRVMAKRRRRKQEKERRRAQPAGATGTAPHQNKRMLQATARERLLAAKEAGPWLCIDLSMSSHMTKKETSRLAAQIRRLYGSNKKAGKPFWICLTSFVMGSPVYQECIRMNDGFSGYLMDTTPESYLDLFPAERIVYLTPDSHTALQDVDPHKVYVLGGLVDESIQKERSLQQARAHTLQTARLPIAEYMVRRANTRNYHSETLAINQVCDALVTFCATRSWPEALKAAVPPGKGYVLREAAT